MDEKNCNYEFGEALKRVTDWGLQLQAEKPGLFRSSTKQADLFLDKPKFPPVVFECKFAESGGDPAVDVKQKLGLTCSDKCVHCVGADVGFGVAVKYPLGVKDWDTAEVAKKFVEEGERVAWKFVRGPNPNAADEWPKRGWLEGTISDLAESVSRTVATAEEIAEVSDAAVRSILDAARVLASKLENHPEEAQRIAAVMGLPTGLDTDTADNGNGNGGEDESE